MMVGRSADHAEVCQKNIRYGPVELVSALRVFHVSRREWAARHGTNSSPPSFRSRRDFLVGDLLVPELRHFDPGTSVCRLYAGDVHVVPQVP
ncbi:unnamed protein product [Prunus armeniaca]